MSDSFATPWTVAQASQVALAVKNPPANAGHIRAECSVPGQEDCLEEGMATHASILAWRILWTEEPGGLQSMHACMLSLFSCIRLFETP